MFDAIYSFCQAHTEVQSFLRLLAAAVLGGIIGLEREHHGRSAGFRTQLLVALGSALAMVVSIHFAEAYGGAGVNSALRVDPARVAYGVMAGIGFLGAGAIIKYGANIRGMTTAASLWCTAAMGLACGIGMYIVAVIATGLVLIALLALRKVDELLIIHWYKTLTVRVKGAGGDNVKRFRDLLKAQGVKVIDQEYSCDVTAGVETIRFFIRIASRKRPTKVNWFEGQSDVLMMSVR
ncbi:MAG: MgtC/SapB family protein [Phycisphaerae bacterium]